MVTAAVSTLGDYLWANALPHGQPIYWFAHAIVLFLAVGFCLGWPSHKPLAGAIGAAAIGCVATAGFYFLQPLMGYSAMFVLFVALWVGLGLLTGRVLQERHGVGGVLARSALGHRLGTRLLRDLGDLDAIQPSRLGLRAALRLLDARVLPRLCRTTRTTAIVQRCYKSLNPDP